MSQLTLLAVCGVVLLLAAHTHCTDEHREKRIGDNDFFQANYNAAQEMQRQQELKSFLDNMMESVGKRSGVKRNDFENDLYQKDGLDSEIVRRLMARYFDQLDAQS
ncbi:uncharacterized protein LOC119726453 [Patiria miniata]|uniref:Uncharacterized protein n=1 Tax=Patiria miniata TaxID=46514 RepID=A0A913ZRN6_PATMI|nr:uncharacterized protein LOC119726453 [Patiria miniata]